MKDSEPSGSAPFSAETYFATQPPPPSLDHDMATVRSFVRKQTERGMKVVLVTSGGTTVPLERNMVRFLDNFSAGTRGATSAEYFIKAGYSVIFMHRQFSLQPFSRHYSHSTNPFLDLLEIEHTNTNPSSPLTAVPNITVTPSKREDLLEVLAMYKKVHHDETMLTLNFATVNDYLWMLRAISHELSLLGRSVMYYLAAAVSDFFLPSQKMSEHKIQSGKGSLHIEMDQVPKILKSIVDEWSREGFIVSFKLETDPALLLPKCRQALERYGHQVVIGNDLHRRKFEVVFVSRNGPNVTEKASNTSNNNFGAGESHLSEYWLRLGTSDASASSLQHPREIEEDIVRELERRHQLWIDAAS
ncbi:hypothetical protein JAAARDRAFT_193114 [Jaapia argillacea MUCL 33604]|uniref:DNA/pantothenate metabolism flavoprotein C-terminal domain-containing protein n=1 Tax=Jaapia argillacea MUCL 33604 TaxID=933084 RepID=A0A067Q500_9AGAM|nr:hypothetical protein JAAARDRAFT_193114 [Jaapia argillacea MUCL 33604]